MNRDVVIRRCGELVIAVTVLAAGVRAQRPLDGVIDIHVHSAPDNVERSIDSIDVAKLARDRGMRAIVLKSHYEPTATMAFIVRKEVAGIEVFGGIDLNLSVGGMNAAAVEHMTQVSGGFGRLVWMSTFDAENQVRYSKENRPFVRVSKDGQLLQEVKDVIAVIAKHPRLVLATGHVSPEEGLMLVREGKRQGVTHMVVTHAMMQPVLMNVAQMQEAAKEGAFVEFVSGSIAGRGGQAKVDSYADAINKVGAESCILASDLGQKNNPLPPDGLADFIAALRTRGMTSAQIDLIAKRNPARLLELQ
jgi:Family of unknown function (DUF6282)